MPLELEAKAACLTFIPDPQKRLETVQKLENPPKFSNLSWFINVFRGCVGEDGWLDHQSMQALVSSGLIPKRLLPTARPYIRVIATHERLATPQLLLPVDLEQRLVGSTYGFKVYSVDDAKDFLNGSGRWKRRDYSGTRSRLLEASFQDNCEVQKARDLIAEALSRHSLRMAV